jgi:hypothetical protein
LHTGPLLRFADDGNADQAGIRTNDRSGLKRPPFAGVFVIAAQAKSGAFRSRFHKPFSLSEVPLRPDLPFGQQRSF